MFQTGGLNFPVAPLGSAFVSAVGLPFQFEEWTGCLIQGERLVAVWRVPLLGDCFAPGHGLFVDGFLVAIPMTGEMKSVRRNFLGRAAPSDLPAKKRLWGQVRIGGQSE